MESDIDVDVLTDEEVEAKLKYYRESPLWKEYPADLLAYNRIIFCHLIRDSAVCIHSRKAQKAYEEALDRLHEAVRERTSQGFFAWLFAKIRGSK